MNPADNPIRVADFCDKHEACAEGRPFGASAKAILAAIKAGKVPGVSWGDAGFWGRTAARHCAERDQALADLALANEACAEKQAAIEKFMIDEQEHDREMQQALADLAAQKARYRDTLNAILVSIGRPETCDSLECIAPDLIAAQYRAVTAQRDQCATLLYDILQHPGDSYVESHIKATLAEMEKKP